jgi:8-oxo-dGTP pyrophosphatase MutT (NUDIX family)
MTATHPATPRLSATVILVRDDPDLRVLLIQRHGAGDFADALVFPGGLVDPIDSEPGWSRLAPDYDATPEGERALRIAAYRELFEETGLLPGLAACGGQAPATSGLGPFADHLLHHGHRLLLGDLHPFAHWITPEVAPRRFDTRFYLCACVTAQEAVFDGVETLGGQWLAPAEAVEMSRSGERKIVFPTRMNLELLAASRTVEEAVAAARARPVATITPWRERRADGDWMIIPPDAGYGVSELPVGPHDVLPRV